MGYKGAKGIPKDFKRDFNRISALLETADKEFIRLRNELKNYDENIRTELKSDTQAIEINANTLKQFISTDISLHKVNVAIAAYYKVNLTESDYKEIGELSENLLKCEFNSIQQVKDHLIRFENQLIEYVKKKDSNRYGDVISVSKTVGVFTLIGFVKDNKIQLITQ